jgi:peptide deformylase
MEERYVAVRKILLLGNPTLYEVSAEVARGEMDRMEAVVRDLHDTMIDFRARHGFGKAIAAPQIGVMKRLVHMDVDGPVTFVNPTLSDCSDETFELWDNCMSFPDILVRVRRHRRCRITFRDLQWNERQIDLEDDLSELLQHECDHLDGVLAVMRAIDGRSFAYESQRGLL